jgi:hypothetical protein
VVDAVASSSTPVRWVVVTAEPVTSVDVTAADVLAELNDTLAAADVQLRFAEMKDPVKDKLKKFGVLARFGEPTFYATIGEAVDAYLATHPVEWVDWQERSPQHPARPLHHSWHSLGPLRARAASLVGR